MTNYYSLLGIESDVSEESIREAIKKERRRWNQRSSHPKQEIRTEAEQRVRQIAEAENILLDTTKREQYDKKLSNSSERESSHMPLPSGEKDWVEITKYYYKENNNLNSAAYAAREAIQQQPGNPEAWYWKSLVSADMKNYTDADFELSEAIRIDPVNPYYQYELGSLYFDRGMYQEALMQFINVQKTNSDFFGDDGFLRLRIRCLWGMKKYPVAYPIFSDYFNRNGGNPEVANLYASFISDMILNSWSYDSTGSKSITNMNQYNFTKQFQQVLNNIPIYDQILLSDIAKFNEYVTELEEMVYESAVEGIPLFEEELSTSVAKLGIALLGGKKMLWQWYAMRLSDTVLQTGMQQI